MRKESNEGHKDTQKEGGQEIVEGAKKIMNEGGRRENGRGSYLSKREGTWQTFERLYSVHVTSLLFN